jgi:multiple sugar transport system substrate-binding protein
MRGAWLFARSGLPCSRESDFLRPRLPRASRREMSESTILRGIGWDHPRCMNPLRASVRDYNRIVPEVEILWDTRSLREFGEGDFGALLEYDLVVFDHPYCGQVAAEQYLVNLRTMLSNVEERGFADDSLGLSWTSYQSKGGIWGLPLDAAAQVASFRPDLIEVVGYELPGNLDEVLSFAAAARRKGIYVGFPCGPTDAICTFLTLCANGGFPVPRHKTGFPGRSDILVALEAMMRLASAAHPDSYAWNPIRCFDRMTCTDEVAYVPYAFGYCSYARPEYSHPLRFTDIPGLQSSSCNGSVLGGAGLGISARSKHRVAAFEYARYICAADYQATTYFQNGGQPASKSAWSRPENDKICSNFLSCTRNTMEKAYLRPTFDGFIPYFRAAGRVLTDYLRGRVSAPSVADWLRTNFLKAGGAGKYTSDAFVG